MSSHLRRAEMRVQRGARLEVGGWSGPADRRLRRVYTAEDRASKGVREETVLKLDQSL